ncbi:short chain dehydrogenase, partial [Mycobacterium tuberculosis]|nr:short chain dehydrogenase [Mycobacterium tuberculosis]
DKIDGPYYFFPLLALLGMLPSRLPLPMPDLGRLNLVPVDFVAEAIVTLVDHDPLRGGQVFHLGDSRDRGVMGMYNALAPAIGSPKGVGVVSNRIVAPALAMTGFGPITPIRDLIASQAGIPPALLDGMRMTADFRSTQTLALLGRLGVALPDLDQYGPRLWEFWA